MEGSGPHLKKDTVFNKKIIRGGLLIAAAALLIFGVLKGGHTDVRNKAIRICYECIGIG